jgi:hypothetical protein
MMLVSFAHFSRLHDRPPLFLSLFWSHNVDCTLRCDFNGEEHRHQREKDPLGNSLTTIGKTLQKM